MIDEKVKENYRILQEQLGIIRKKFDELEEIYEDLILNTRESFCIDDKIIFEEYYQKIKSGYNIVKNETIKVIIPSIKNKL